MKTQYLAIILISFFCAVDFIFIQSNFFFPCGWESIEHNAFRPAQCDVVIQNLRSIIGMAASIGIAAIVGISALFSPKKSALIVGTTVGLYVLFIVMRQILYLSITTVPSGIMRPLTLPEVVLTRFVESPVWFYIFVATIFSTVTWPIVVLRHKILKGLK